MTERNLLAMSPTYKANCYSWLHSAEDYIKSRLDETEYFCKCLDKEIEEKRKEQLGKEFLETIKSKRLGMSSSELKEKDRRDSEWRIINAIKNNE